MKRSRFHLVYRAALGILLAVAGYYQLEVHAQRGRDRAQCARYQERIVELELNCKSQSRRFYPQHPPGL